MTKQRKLVLSIVENSHRHPSAEEIFFEAKESMPSIALGTVYRNLNALHEEGKIRKITLPGASDRYDKAMIPHDHLICEKCGQIKDICLDGVEEALSRSAKCQIARYELNAYYVCDECRSNQ